MEGGKFASFFMKKVEIWTDGCSKGNPGIGGYGIVLIYKDNKKEHIKEIKQGFKLTTNNRMELMAGIVALRELKYSCDVTFYSDSKYVVDAFNSGWVDSWEKKNFRLGKSNEVKNIELWKEMIEEVKKHKIKFVWVKGHAGNKYNERCDLLANMALDEELIDDVY